MAMLANGIMNGMEFLVHHEAQDYNTYLGRSPGSAEVAGWAQAVKTGLVTMEQADAWMTTSAEYVARHGGAYNATWVNSLYTTFLNRSAAPAEAAAWANAVQAGQFSPVVVAAFIAGSAEREARVVTNCYTSMLFRSPGAAELNAWVHGYQVGIATQTIEAYIMGSAEYGSRFSSSPACLTQYYIDALGRQPGLAEFPLMLGPYNVGYNPTVWAFKAGNEATAASYDDINQTAGTCYLLAPLAAAALDGVDLVSSNRIWYLGNNYFSAKFYDENNHVPFWYRVGYNGVPSATDPTPSPEGDYWPILYQRAYVNLYEGGDPYGGHWPELVLPRLTGYANSTFFYNGTPGTNDFWNIDNNYMSHPIVA